MKATQQIDYDDEISSVLSKNVDDALLKKYSLFHQHMHINSGSSSIIKCLKKLLGDS
jgi:hypothetical protein